MPYKQYWKSEFQNALTLLANKNKLKRWSEISASIECDHIPINEYVYKFSLLNKSVSIIIYSSIEKQNDRTRDNATDAVRIVYEWTTKDGKKYCKIEKHYRTESLLTNMSQSITAASIQCFALGEFEWVEENIR